ncbi:MAG: hypothetical protein LC803_09345 [Acidobacteria bacterium]|nr:hypothetical protein [Acidobacteriota bacterium]
MAVWSGFGFNYGHDVSTVAYDLTGTVNHDFGNLLAAGCTKLRLAYRPYNSNFMSHTYNLATYAKARGFRVTAGVTVGTTGANLTQWNAYIAALPSIATQYQTIGIDEFAIGNEAELHIDGTTITATQARSDLKDAATACKAVFSGVVSYQADSGNIAAWASAGRGTIDRLGFNIYGSDSSFRTNVSSVVTNFGANGYISEWSTQDGYIGSNWNEASWSDNLVSRSAFLEGSGIASAYFFCYNAGAYNVAKDTWGLKASTGDRIALDRLLRRRSRVTI